MKGSIYTLGTGRERRKLVKFNTLKETGLIISNQVIQLFDTLSRHVYLARHLRRLGMFPKSLFTVYDA